MMSKYQGRETPSMTDQPMALPQGTLDLLILKALALEPLHGWAISERLEQISAGALQVGQGSLYPSLHRLERRGWLKARWRVTEANRRAKYYELSATGRRQLAAATADWRKLTAVVGGVLDLGES
jgi:PadR family transcriptional regulator